MRPHLTAGPPTSRGTRGWMLRAAAVAGAIGLATAALPMAVASADPTGDSSATITLSGGSLNITVPTGPAVSLGTAANTSAGILVSGSLGGVTVLDTRGVITGGWVTTAVSTDFTLTGATAIPATLVGYAAGTFTNTGTVTATATDIADSSPGLSVAVTVVTGTLVAGNADTLWDPTITIAVPASASAGQYAATFTHSVA